MDRGLLRSAIPGKSAEQSPGDRICCERCFLHFAGHRAFRLYPKKQLAKAVWALQIPVPACRSSVPARRFLYYVPLVILASGNLWNGVALHYSLMETVCRIVCMLFVGFLEEVIFRGLLFAAIARDHLKSAVIISSVTFGIGHIINLFNGSGMNLVNNLCQIVFAITVGFLLVTIFYRGGSLLPCIFVHAAINTLGTFANDMNLTTEMHLLHPAVLIAITAAYTLILTRTLPKAQQEKRN